MFPSFDLHLLRNLPEVAYHFRYPLHAGDFHEVREDGRLLGRVAAKPLYGRLTRAGKVDRSAGYDGQIAVLFIPARARTPGATRLLLTRIPRDRVVTDQGRRNWAEIRRAAEQAVRQRFSSQS